MIDVKANAGTFELPIVVVFDNEKQLFINSEITSFGDENAGSHLFNPYKFDSLNLGFVESIIDQCFKRCQFEQQRFLDKNFEFYREEEALTVHFYGSSRIDVLLD